MNYLIVIRLIIVKPGAMGLAMSSAKAFSEASLTVPSDIISFPSSSASRWKGFSVGAFSSASSTRSAASSRVRASQSVLTKGFEKKHHVLIIHCSPFPFLSQATLESSFLIYSIQGNPSDSSQVSRAIQRPNARSIFIESDI